MVLYSLPSRNCNCRGFLSASAATYYVDFAAGADANSGAAGAAFQHCPGDSAAVQTALATALRSGDTVIFKGGVTYLGQTITCASGVTYDGNSAGTFGTGSAILSGQHSTIYTKCFSATNLSNVTFSNLTITQWGGHGSVPWLGHDAVYAGWGVYLSGCTNCTVKNCLIEDIGDWLNQANADGNRFAGVGIAVIDSGSDVTIAGNELTQIGLAAIQLNAYQGTAPTVQRITITGNNIHDSVVWGVNMITNEPNSAVNGITVDGNRFHDMWQYSSELWLGMSGTWPHTDEIICFAGGAGGGGHVNPVTFGTTASPIVIRNNVFYDNASPALTAGTACIFLSNWGGRTLIYNNVFANVLNHGEGAVYFQDGAGPGNPVPDYWVTNNTFYDNDYAVMLRTVSAPLASYALTNGTIRIKNNIFYKANNDAALSVYFGLDPYSNPTELDYNIYRTGRTDGDIAYSYNPAPSGQHTAYGYRTLADLQSQGYELHSQVADPQYVDVSSGVGTRTSGNDLHLQSSSPAIGAGLNLTSVLGALADANGNAYPANAAWDAGAYQFVAGSNGQISAMGQSVAATISAPVVAAPAPVLEPTPTPAPTPDPAPVAVTTPVTVSTPVEQTTVATPTTVSTPAAVTSPVATSSSSSATAATSHLSNLSARASVSAGDDALIVGFGISGGTKAILLRGVGPALAPMGVGTVLAQPDLSLFNGGSLMAENQQWGGSAALQSTFAQTGAFPLATPSDDTALLLQIPAGSYTAQVTAVGGNSSGVALAELYDADTSAFSSGRLVNISARAKVGTEANILIVGFTVSGTAPERLLIRAVGPTLSGFGVSSPLARPQLVLLLGGTVVQQNSGWNGDSTLSAASAAVGAVALSSSNDAAMIVTLQPGQYSVQVSGMNGTTGVALAEVYELP